MNLYGLIGFPLSHSFSAGFFEKKFADENITDAQYRLFPLEDISSLAQLLKQQQNLQGFNITIPYKVAILPQLDHISKVAASVGAVNCVKVAREQSGTKLTGFNTDVFGFRESLIPLLKPYHYQALILGTGGAAKAVCYSLLELGISYTMVSRTVREKSHLHYSELTEEIINENKLIINATPAGMYPHTESFPDIPYHFLGNRHLMYDLIYNPAETQFLKKSIEAGAIIKNGLQMLELQAQKSWEIWKDIQ
jgi:shikimate dehydrogenase